MQWALIWPVVMIAIFGIIQAAVVMQARSAVTEAARAAVRAEALAGSRPGDALDAARQVAAPSGVRAITVRLSEADGLVRAQVTGSAPILLDAGSVRLSAAAVAIREGT
ncbi:TadE/TadG family type IV pilus assembly protein [Acidipropionibacterium jensenii]|uniref:TadE/TadG family type IV pilus assembly protein n=1 Tax=Acidipropionibacterium jensenii TaxID=1749 RepID=UPI00214C7E62